MPNRTSAAAEIARPVAVRAARRRPAVAALLLVTALAGCTPQPRPAQTPTEPELVARVKAVISMLNAATTPGQQRAALLELADPGQRATQQSCGPAQGTLTLEPVYGYLAPAPNYRPTRGTMAGPVYSLPALVRVHRDGRIIGSDVADLHLSITGDLVALAAVCPS